MIDENIITTFLNQNNYDLRESHNGRWIDQKCTPDAVSIIADCICAFNSGKNDELFTSMDIWHSQYTHDNILSIFKKPGVNEEAARNEYDKFFQQPMEMLANAGVLIKEKRGARNFYRIGRWDILEYIAIRERNALVFLCRYIEKVLRDSGLILDFERFFASQDKDAYDEVKTAYSNFIIENTPINGQLECGRIFAKVINPLAYERNALGTERGHISEHIITYDMLMYNRNNFRDIYANKPKGITRKQYLEAHPVEINIAYYHYQSAKAKRFLRIFNDSYRNSEPEYQGDIHANDKATQMHHIFPESDFPEICYYLENIIALTPTQHFNYAHPVGQTQKIDKAYQQLLLLAKTERIKENLTGDCKEKIYSFDNLKHVLVVGFDDADIEEIESDDYVAVMNTINAHYASEVL